MSDAKRNNRKSIVGVVVSDKMDKTRVVSMNYTKSHPQYGKVIKRTAKVHAHDQNNESKTGDQVRLVATRKLSKTKTWRIASVLTKK